MAAIRRFLNRDTFRLAAVWQEHWQMAGIATSTTASQLEQAILDKPFFSYEDLYVVDRDGTGIAFAQLQIDPSEDPPIRARIATICVGQCDDRLGIARQLIEAVLESCKQRGIKTLEAGTILGDLSGLVGLEPYAGVIGLLDEDQFIVDLFRGFDFQTERSLSALELNLDTFRMPVDRDLLMLRRTANLEERPGSIPKDWRAACAHSHFDISKFLVLNRAGTIIATATYYLSDPDALVMDRGLLYLAGFDGYNTPATIDLANEIRYAVAGSLPHLVQRRFKTVRAIIDSQLQSADARTSFLNQIGFRQAASGKSYFRAI